MNETNMCKRLLFTFVLLSMESFFNPGGLFTQQDSKFLRYIVFIISFIICLNSKCKYQKNDYPFYSYWGLIIVIFLSILPAAFFHDQPFSVSLISILSFVTSYLFLYVLFRLAIPKHTILKVLKHILIISSVVYFVNFVTAPNIIFGSVKEEYDMSRGIVRLWIPFFDLHVLGLFYAINQWILNGKKIYIYWIVFAYVMVFLSVIRQALFYSAILGIWMFLRNASFTKKVLVCIFASIIVLIVLPRISAFQTMMELTERQQEEYGTENIRILAWDFYTKEAQANDISPIIGNGVPAYGKSDWGNEMQAITDFNHCFAVDVGWAGFYFFFGAIGVIFLGCLLIMALRKNKQKEEKYLNYWILYIILTSFTSAPIMYPHQIFCIMFVLYLIYGKEYEEDRNCYIKLQ